MASTIGIAWRNLGRNRRRTVVTGAALALGTCLSVAAFGLTDGMDAGLLDTLTRFDLGHIQIHQPDFPRTHALDKTIDAPDQVLAEARAEDGVEAATPRVYSYALLSHGDKSLGAQLVGVDPKTEPTVTRLDRQRTAGTYLPIAATPWPRGRKLTAAEKAEDQKITNDETQAALDEIEDLGSLDAGSGAGSGSGSGAAAGSGSGSGAAAGSGSGSGAAAPSPAAADTSRTVTLADALSPPPAHPPPVFVGASLARVLHAKVGDELHATGQTVDGQTESATFRVVGIFTTGTAMLDRGRIYMNIADLQRFVHLQGRVHEIALLTASPSHAPAIAHDLAEHVDGQHLLVRDWSQIRPDIKQMLSLEEVTTAVMIFIILFVATLGVVNTMLMAVFERTRELGVLKAIGMSPMRVVWLIVAETTILVLAASTVGTVLGLGIDMYMAHFGFDLSWITSGISFGGLGVNPVLYSAVTAHGLILPTAILAATCFLASFYPAARAARLRPAIGMRET